MLRLWLYALLLCHHLLLLHLVLPLPHHLLAPRNPLSISACRLFLRGMTLAQPASIKIARERTAAKMQWMVSLRVCPRPSSKGARCRSLSYTKEHCDAAPRFVYTYTAGEQGNSWMCVGMVCWCMIMCVCVLVCPGSCKATQRRPGETRGQQETWERERGEGSCHHHFLRIRHGDTQKQNTHTHSAHTRLWCVLASRSCSLRVQSRSCCMVRMFFFQEKIFGAIFHQLQCVEDHRQHALKIIYVLHRHVPKFRVFSSQTARLGSFLGCRVIRHVSCSGGDRGKE